MTTGSSIKKENQNNLFAIIGEDGWISPNAPPNSDRKVQLAWEDRSFSATSFGFYDSVAEIPQSGKMYWWSISQMPYLSMVPDWHVGAWREIIK